MIYLLIDGDYLLSGFKPTSDDVVRAAVEALQHSVEQQLLHPHGGTGAAAAAPPSYAAQIQVRVVFFSSALLNSLPENQRQCIVSTLRRLRFQVVTLESIRGRVGSPVDGALCTKIVSLGLMPSAEPPAFCLVAPNAYTAPALDLVTGKGCDVMFVVYSGDDVAEELLGYISPSFGGGVATMAKSEGVAYVQNTEAAASALAVLQQEGKDLPISVVSELRRLQMALLDGSQAQSKTAPRALTATIMESTRRRKEEQAFFQPPPPIENCPNPFEDLQMNGASQHSKDVVVEEDDDHHHDKSPTVGVHHEPSGVTGSEFPESRMLFSVRTQVSLESSPAAVVRVATVPDAAPPPLPADSIVPQLPASVLALTPDGVTTQVPDGWALLFAPAHHRHYYAYTDSKGVTRSTWEHPLGRAYRDEVQSAAEAWWVAKRQEREDQALAAAGATEALPPGWEERVHEETGRKYYVNHNTRETTWQPPTQQPQAATTPLHSTPASSVKPSTASRASTTVASAATPAPSTTKPGAAAASAHGLPEGWEEKVDPRSGRTYYVNHATRETTWDAPQQPAGAAPTPFNSVSTPAASTTSNADDWEARVDARNGRTYYVNHRTRETSWTKPSAGAAATAKADTASALEDRWEAKVDPQSGRTFYVNHATRQTSWTRPSNAAVKAQTPPASVTSSQRSGNGEVAYPWEARTDPTTGRTYYLNHTTKQTTWTRPG